MRKHLLPAVAGRGRSRRQRVDVMSHYHALRSRTFSTRSSKIVLRRFDGREGREHVELFSAVYRLQRDRRPVRFPLSAYAGAEFFDGRLNPTGRP